MGAHINRQNFAAKLREKEEWIQFLMRWRLPHNIVLVR